MTYTARPADDDRAWEIKNARDIFVASTGFLDQQGRRKSRKLQSIHEANGVLL
jgi:hypothetical protein